MPEPPDEPVPAEPPLDPVLLLPPVPTESPAGVAGAFDGVGVEFVEAADGDGDDEDGGAEGVGEPDAVAEAGSPPLREGFGEPDLPPPSPSHPASARVSTTANAGTITPARRRVEPILGMPVPDVPICELPPRYVPPGL
ncbi:hypothetical protein ACFRCG_20710 [Embleya sp. NPDC056575]|uniref:hypothetical protein n=1 Tax=unclassified Embleya TaxID=2699296 RepID=UPI0036B31025